jgi:hypothetical protein
MEQKCEPLKPEIDSSMNEILEFDMSYMSWSLDHQLTLGNEMKIVEFNFSWNDEKR